MISDTEQRDGRRLYFFNWVPLLLLAVSLGACLAASNFSLKLESWTRAVVIASVLTAAGLWLLSYWWGSRFGFALLAIAQIGFMCMLVAPLSYVAAAANLPLQDASLARMDQLLGLDWRAYFEFAIARPELLSFAIFFYAMIIVPWAGVSVALGMTGRFVRLQQFVMAAVLTVSVAVIISAALPAIGTYGELGLPADTEVFKASGYVIQLEILPFVRDGTLRVLNLSHLGGIITFPSVHAAIAALAIWGLWGVWWLRPLALILNGGMLLATPLVGGHYFVDVFAGVGLAALSIAAAKAISQRIVTGVEVVPSMRSLQGKLQT
ncbi:phosphatase PAP2 family protein [Bradyrhizobium sp. dw_78]|uniref:phosphatase PAP2 family protein n=1 Tax=Bradyrhizobium sp. dw_78 TaxID=2719793 RepID=UPI001BD5BAFC|nr:phosphatase PAP2 family protein [Bradyrhizobium sp. dw_78]